MTSSSDESQLSDDAPKVEVRTVWNGSTDVWVYEHTDRRGDGKMVLVFETEYGSRRALEYPTNWRDMTDSELMELSAKWD